MVRHSVERATGRDTRAGKATGQGADIALTLTKSTTDEYARTDPQPDTAYTGLSTKLEI